MQQTGDHLPFVQRRPKIAPVRAYGLLSESLDLVKIGRGCHVMSAAHVIGLTGGAACKALACLTHCLAGTRHMTFDICTDLSI